MTPDAFEDLLDRYGGDRGAWPMRMRADVAQLLVTSAQARRALAAMQEAEHLLGLLGVPTAVGPDAMASRAMRQPQVRPARRAAFQVGWAAAAAAALAIGILVGGTSGVEHDDDAAPTFATIFGQPEVVDVN